MRHPLRCVTLLPLLAVLTGCAGGWKGGVVPAQWAATTPAAASTAPAATSPAKAGSTSATHATADGAVFVWTGEANTVNVAGEFNAWSTSADPMTKQAGGGFVLAKTLAKGRYAYKFVVNGSDWKPDPAAMESVDDGFGGKNSVVVVTGDATAAAPAATAAAVPAAGAPAVTANGVVFTWKGGGGSANLAGEFNAWSTSADPMVKQADGSFSLTKKLAPGRYAYKFVIDGTNWKEDPAAKEFVDDGFGGKNSVVVVGTGTAPAAPAPAAATATPATGDGVVFTWTGGGGSANLAGEFNAWSTSADPMVKRADGSFTLTKKLSPGRYAYKFVIDGTNWKEDPAAKEFVDDGYGGKNSVIVVGGASAASAPAAAPATPVRSLAPGAAPRAPRLTADGVVFTYAGPAKSSVSLCGDFNAWATTTDVMKQQDDGTWTVTRKLAPGTYAYKFLVDGMSWKKDDGNAQEADDGFGGRNSVVTVK